MLKGDSDETKLLAFNTCLEYSRLKPYLESVLAFSGGTPLHLVFIRFVNCQVQVSNPLSKSTKKGFEPL